MTTRRILDPAIIRARMEAGEFNVDLAREYGVTAGAISNSARRGGYVWANRRVQTKPRGDGKITHDQRKAIVSRFLAGEKQISLAAEYGVSRSAISTIIKLDLRFYRDVVPNNQHATEARA